MKAAASTLTVLAMLLSSTTAWASVGDCSAMMRGHKCCCQHDRAKAQPSARDQLGSEPMHCCDSVGACAAPAQAPASTTAVQVDAPVGLPVAAVSHAAAPASPVEPLPECSRGPPGPAHALYVQNCSWLI